MDMDKETYQRFAELRDSVERDFTLSLLDAAINEKSSAISSVMAWFKLEWMMDPLYRDICDAIFDLVQREVPVSLSTILRPIVPSAKMHGGSAATIKTLCSAAFGWFHLPYYGRQVYDEYRRSAVSTDAVSAAEDIREGHDLEQGIAELALIPEKYMSLQIERVDKAKDACDQIISELEGVATPNFRLGIPSVDDITHGFRNGSLVTVAAPTGSGKTVMLGQAALTRATRDNKHVLYFSGEMTLKELAERWCCAISEVSRSSCNVRENRLKYMNALAQIRLMTAYDGNLQVFEAPMHVDQIVSTVRGYASATKVGLVCLDYVQMYSGATPKETRERQVADITGKMKMLAMELSCPIMVASQFNRNYTGSPGINNLRDSGSIAQDSDAVLIIDPSDDKNSVIAADVAVVKNRHGSCGVATTQWNKPLFTFADPVPEPHDFPGY